MVLEALRKNALMRQSIFFFFLSFCVITSKVFKFGFATSDSLTVHFFLLGALWEAVCVIMSVMSQLHDINLWICNFLIWTCGKCPHHRWWNFVCFFFTSPHFPQLFLDVCLIVFWVMISLQCHINLVFLSFQALTCQVSWQWPLSEVYTVTTWGAVDCVSICNLCIFKSKLSIFMPVQL